MGRDERWRRLFFEAAEDLGTEPLRDADLAGGIFGTPAETRQELGEQETAAREARDNPPPATEAPAAATETAAEATPAPAATERPAEGTAAAVELEKAETAVAAGTATEAQRKFAGKYDTIEQFEQGYGESQQRMHQAISQQRAAEAELAAMRVAARQAEEQKRAAASPWGFTPPHDTETLVELALKDSAAAWRFVKSTPEVSKEEREAVENHYAREHPAAYQKELTDSAIAAQQQQQYQREAPRIEREQRNNALAARGRLVAEIPDYPAYEKRMAAHIAADPAFFDPESGIYDDANALTDRMKDLYFWLKGQDVLADAKGNGTPVPTADTPATDPQQVKDAGAVITTGSHTGTPAAPGQGPTDSAYKSTIFGSEP